VKNLPYSILTHDEAAESSLSKFVLQFLGFCYLTQFILKLSSIASSCKV